MNFLLLHGAWHGGWVWEGVAQWLRSQGHNVDAPDFPGLGDDAVHLSPAIDLERHVCAVMPATPTIICAHSYAGMVARIIADRRPDLVSSVVLIEALWPDDGQCAFDLLADQARQLLSKRRDEEGDGWRLLPPDPRQFDLDSSQLESMVSSRMTDHPARTFEETVALKSQAPAGTFVIANDRHLQPYTSIAETLRKKGWRIVETSGGHELMLTQPDFIASILLETASSQNRKDTA